jgi:hypothetical protein
MRLRIQRVVSRTTTENAWFLVGKSIGGDLRLRRVSEAEGQRLGPAGPRHERFPPAFTGVTCVCSSRRRSQTPQVAKAEMSFCFGPETPRN